MIIICDTSPLIALSLCNELRFLDILFKDVIVPEKVFDEIMGPGKPEAEKIAAWVQGKVQKAAKEQMRRALALSLDAGESEAIALFWEKSADFLLIDEQKGRRIAARHGIKVVGTLGILLLAKQKGLVKVIKPHIELLRRSSIRISEYLYQKALEIAGEAPL
jgi:predicted nucleic acid-binding protein